MCEFHSFPPRFCLLYLALARSTVHLRDSQGRHCGQHRCDPDDNSTRLKTRLQGGVSLGRPPHTRSVASSHVCKLVRHKRSVLQNKSSIRVCSGQPAAAGASVGVWGCGGFVGSEQVCVVVIINDHADAFRVHHRRPPTSPTEQGVILSE